MTARSEASTSRGIVLVTGGAGFIGSHVCTALLACGRRVRVLDDLSTGHLENLAHLSVGREPRLEVVEGSILDANLLTEAMREVSEIVHLAAKTSVAESVGAPALYQRVNVEGTAMVCTAAQRADIKRLVFAASSSAYGLRPPPHDETDAPDPTSPYAATKLEGEALVHALAQSSAVDAVALRFFNIYGPRQDPSSAYAAVIARVMARVAANETLTVFSDGLQTRDFVHAADTARAVVAALDAKVRLSGAVINIGTGNATTVLELAKQVGLVLGKRVTVTHAPAREGEVRHSVATVARAERLLGFKATTALFDGLRTMLERAARDDR